MEQIVKNGNTKLGKGIGKVSLPAVQTCPGRGECEQFCYAARLMMRFPNYDQMVQSHLQILENNPKGYMETVIQNVKDAGYSVVRVHESGDFKDAGHIRLWIKIAKAMPHVQFYAYTRSWTVPRLRQALIDLKNVDNFSLRASVEETETAPFWLPYTTVVAKDETQRPEGGIICHEQTGKKPDCKTCGVCWKSNAPVLFLKH